MMLSSTPQKAIFNPYDPQHRAAYIAYRTTNQWGTAGCPFKLVWPFLSIPAMCQDMLLDYYIETAETRMPAELSA